MVISGDYVGNHKTKKQKTKKLASNFPWINVSQTSEYMFSSKQKETLLAATKV